MTRKKIELKSKSVNIHMLVIEVEGIEVHFDLEQLVARIDGIENCLQLVLMEIGNYLLETRQCAKMMEIRKIEKNSVLAIATLIIQEHKLKRYWL
jgi:hypothetical protein